MSERLQILQRIIDDLRRKIGQGCTVYVGGVKVESIDMVPSRNGAIIIINNNITYYASRFLQLKRTVICHENNVGH